MQSTILAALANKTRLQLLTCLARKEKNVSELIATCGLSQSAVSQHLRKLRASGLVETSRHGKSVYYRLRYPESAAISQTILTFIKEVAI